MVTRATKLVPPRLASSIVTTCTTSCLVLPGIFGGLNFEPLPFWVDQQQLICNNHQFIHCWGFTCTWCKLSLAGLSIKVLLKLPALQLLQRMCYNSSRPKRKPHINHWPKDFYINCSISACKIIQNWCKNRTNWQMIWLTLVQAINLHGRSVKIS